MRPALLFPLFALVQVITLAAGSQFVGTWKLNLQQSKFVNMRPISATYVVRAEGGKLSWDWEAEGVNPATGKVEHEGSHTVASLDGIPAVMNTPIYDHVSMKLREPRTIDVKFTKDGKLIRQDQFTVSEDGKTLTVRRGDGTGVIVYDKQ